MKNLKLMINDSGYIVIEIPDCSKSIFYNDYTLFWEEHTLYFTLETLNNFLIKSDFEIVKIKKIRYKKGIEDSIIAIVKKNYKKISNNNYKEINNLKIINFFKNYNHNLKIVKKNILNLREQFNHSKIVIFGAGHLTISFISFYKLESLIDAAIDDNINKSGMYLPIGDIPIFNSKILLDNDIKICLLGLNPLNHDKVISKFKKFKKNGGIFLSIFPSVKTKVKNIY